MYVVPPSGGIPEQVTALFETSLRTRLHIRPVEQSSNTWMCSITATAYTNLWAINLPAIMKGCKLLLKPLSEISGFPQSVLAFTHVRN